MDINWNNISDTEKLKLQVYAATSMAKRTSTLVSDILLSKEDGNKIKISKIRDTLRKVDLGEIKGVSHLRYYIQINSDTKSYTDRILLYSKTKRDIKNFEPIDPKSYEEISKVFSDKDRFFVYKKNK